MTSCSNWIVSAYVCVCVCVFVCVCRIDAYRADACSRSSSDAAVVLSADGIGHLAKPWLYQDSLSEPRHCHQNARLYIPPSSVCNLLSRRVSPLSNNQLPFIQFQWPFWTFFAPRWPNSRTDFGKICPGYLFCDKCWIARSYTEYWSAFSLIIWPIIFVSHPLCICGKWLQQDECIELNGFFWS